jgi:hypothetical protein
MIHTIKLSMWWLPQTSSTHIRESRRFKSIYTMQGKTRSTRHMHLTVSPRMVQTICISRGQCIAIFCEVINSDGQSHCSTKNGLPTQFTTRWLTNSRVRTQFLPRVDHWSSGGKVTLCWRQTTRLTRPISPACDWYVKYLLTGVNSSVLNRHRWGLQPWRRRLSTYHSLTFPTDGLPFPPTGPTRSPVYPNSIN